MMDAMCFWKFAPVPAVMKQLFFLAIYFACTVVMRMSAAGALKLLASVRASTAVTKKLLRVYRVRMCIRD